MPKGTTKKQTLLPSFINCCKALPGHNFEREDKVQEGSHCLSFLGHCPGLSPGLTNKQLDKKYMFGGLCLTTLMHLFKHLFKDVSCALLVPRKHVRDATKFNATMILR
jgi:hypothetical protein